MTRRSSQERYTREESPSRGRRAEDQEQNLEDLETEESAGVRRWQGVEPQSAEDAEKRAASVDAEEEEEEDEDDEERV